MAQILQIYIYFTCSLVYLGMYIASSKRAWLWQLHSLLLNNQQPTNHTMPPALSQTLVVDNGAYTIKAGFATPGAGLDDCLTISNCVARGRDRKVFVGAELDSCKDFGGMAFRRPVERV